MNSLPLDTTACTNRTIRGSVPVVTPVSALELLRGRRKEKKSSFLCLVQNPHFALPLGITELAGPAGVGKTQIALSLCADCVLHQQEDVNENSDSRNTHKAVYIQLGGSSRFLRTASRRIQSMLKSRLTTATSMAAAGKSNARNQYQCPELTQRQHADDDDPVVHD